MRPSIALLVVTLGPHLAHADPAARWELSAAAGASSTSLASPGMELGDRAATDLEPAALFSLRYRIAERVVWSIPTLSFAYLGGSDERAWIPWAGLVSWGAGYSSIEHFLAQGTLGAGIGLRQRIGASLSLQATGALESEARYTSRPVCGEDAMCPARWTSPDAWRASVTAGLSYRLGRSVTLNAGLSGAESDARGATIAVGSVQAIGLRQLPLIEARLGARWSIDGYAAAAYDRDRDRIEQRYLAGVTRRWLATR